MVFSSWNFATEFQLCRQIELKIKIKVKIGDEKCIPLPNLATEYSFRHQIRLKK